MAEEPTKTQKQDGQGRPEYTEEQYAAWLTELRPYLEKGNSIYYACERAGLTTHLTVIYEKYRANDWFSAKIDRYRSRPGEMVNDTLATLCYQIQDNIKKGVTVTKDELDLLKFMAEKHRTAQPFFVSRTETAEADPDKVGKILDTMEVSDYDELGRQAEKQVVADDAPVQNQG